MSAVMTVEEALKTMQGKMKENGEVVVNRFNKKNFNTLMVALANDLEFTTKIAKVKKDECELEDVMVTKGFRQWCKKLVEKAGVDKSESERILTDDFIIDNMDGLYDFFAEAMYQYMLAGNRFDLPNKEDFKGGVYLKDIPESVKVADHKNPLDNSFLGTFETTKKRHKELRAKSSCPTYLSSKRKI